MGEWVWARDKGCSAGKQTRNPGKATSTSKECVDTSTTTAYTRCCKPVSINSPPDIGDEIITFEPPSPVNPTTKAPTKAPTRSSAACYSKGYKVSSKSECKKCCA